MAKEAQTGIQSIQSAVRVVEEMAALGEAVGVTALANRIEMPKVRVFRYLRTLQALGYVEQDPATEKYALTLRLFQIGQAVGESARLLRVARVVLARLRERTGLSAVLSQPEGGGVRILESSRMENAPVVLRGGSLLEFHASAQGRACLAFGPPELWASVRETKLTKCTPLTLVDVESLDVELEASRRRGWAGSASQTAEGINAVAAPVYKHGGSLAAIVNLVAAEEDLPVPPPQRLLRPLLKAAAELSRALGHDARACARDGADVAPLADQRSGILGLDGLNGSARPGGG